MKFALKLTPLLVIAAVVMAIFAANSQVKADPSDPYEYSQFSCFYEVHEGLWTETGCDGIDPATWQNTWDWCSASAGVAFTGEWREDMPWEGSAYYHVYCSRGTYVDPDPYTGPLDPTQNPAPTEPEATPEPTETQEPTSNGTTSVKVVSNPIKRFVPPQPPEVPASVRIALTNGKFVDGMNSGGYIWSVTSGGYNELYLNRFEGEKGASWLLNTDKSIKCKFSDWDPSYGTHREESCVIYFYGSRRNPLKRKENLCLRLPNEN